MNKVSSVTGTLFVVAAPSGAGKSTLVRALLQLEPGISMSISHTTRAPRTSESQGNDYHFVSREEFDAMIAAGQFFEYAVVHGDMKGTSVTSVTPMLEQGRDVLLEIDWQGARQVRNKVPDCQSIFILPPSRVELERRLRNRASDSESAIVRRLNDSRVDIARAHEFDFIVINDNFDDTLAAMRAIVHAVRHRGPVH